MRGRKSALNKQLPLTPTLSPYGLRLWGEGEKGRAGQIHCTRAGHLPWSHPGTEGIEATEASPHELAGVATTEEDIAEHDITVHYWDFGGQVMMHATHQFFLRSGCLYVIVLDARSERNANEEAEYWLEHVRAFANETTPVILVGNKSDKVQITLDQATLKAKHRNIVGFFNVSCTEAKGERATEFVINPRWLTYGVYTIMCSQVAQEQRGRVSIGDIVGALKTARISDSANGDCEAFAYPPDRCGMIVDCMGQFNVAYRLADTQDVVIPALLPSDQPAFDFDYAGAIEFQFDFKGFLPRHVLPSLIVQRHMEIARSANGGEIFWQNGVRLDAGHTTDAEGLIRADYFERTLNIRVTGSDAAAYLGILRDMTLHTLAKMPQLEFEEKVRLRPHMKAGGGELAGPDDDEAWLDYQILLQAQRAGMDMVPGPDGIYDVGKILAAAPLSPDLIPADIFLSYAHADIRLVQNLHARLKSAGYSVWYDRNLVPGDEFRPAIRKRIDHAKAVVVSWTGKAITSKYVIAESQRADSDDKLICLCADDVTPKDIPDPFSANLHIAGIDDWDGLLKGLTAKRVKPS